LVRDPKDRIVPRRSSNSLVAAKAPQFFESAEWSLLQQQAEGARDLVVTQFHL